MASDPAQRLRPGPEERTAGFLANMFQSQFGPMFLIFGAAAFGLGVLTQGPAFFIATGLFVVCSMIAGHLKGEREKRQHELIDIAMTVPQPHAPNLDGLSYAEFEQWVLANPHLVRRWMTREEATALAREHGVDERIYERYIAGR